MDDKELENIDLASALLKGLKDREIGEKIERISFDDHVMEITHTISRRSTCRRHNIAAVLVKDKRIIATGYNGAARNAKDCLELGCLRDQLGIPSGTRHEICRAIHAEQNAIIHAAREGVSTIGTTMYSTIKPCLICAKIIVNAGITRVVYEGTYSDSTGIEFLKNAGVKVENFKTDRLDRYVTKKF